MKKAISRPVRCTRRAIERELRATIEKAFQASAQLRNEIPTDARQRIAELKDTLEAAKELRSRKGPFLALLALALLLLAVLAFFRVSEAEVLLALKTEAFEATSISRQVLLPKQAVDSLLIRGLRQVTLPDPARAGADVFFSDARGTLSLSISHPDQDQAHSGFVSLESYELLENGTFRLEPLGAAGGFSLRVAGGGAPVAAAVQAPLTMLVDGTDTSLDVVQMPPPLVSTIPSSYSQKISIQADAPKISSIEVTAFSATHARDTRRTDVSIDLFGSAVLSGTIAFPHFPGRSVALHSGDELVLEVTTGEIDRIQFDSESVTLRFRGTASSLRVGHPGAALNVMPSFLEKLYYQRNRGVLVGAVLYLISVMISIAHWWRS